MRRTSALGLLSWFAFFVCAAFSSEASSKPRPADVSASAVLMQANQHYHAQHYAKAVEILENLRTKRHLNHFAIHYNLGNAYFRLRRYGHALASYRRAQRLHPNHEDLLHNLQLLYQRTGQADPDNNLRQRALFWYRLLTLRQIFWLTLACLALACLLWGVFLHRNAQGHKGMRWWAASFTLIALLLGGSLTAKFYNEQLVTTGVIIAPKITARSGYGENFEALFTLQEAEEVTVRERTAGWFRIEVWQEDTKQKRRYLRSGWLPEQALTTL